MVATVAVLAGGRGSRIGGDKALARLRGLPLIEYAVLCAQAAELDVCVVAKPQTALPPLEVPVLIEAVHPTHPLCGILTALARYPAVIALPCDMPLLAHSVLTRLAAADTQAMLAVEGEPFPALYTVATLPLLQAALNREASMRSVINELKAPALDGIDPGLLFSVNSQRDLELARNLLEHDHQAEGR